MKLFSPFSRLSRTSAVLALSFSVIGLLFSGCSLLPQPTADPTRFYLLSTSASSSVEPSANAPAIHLRPVELASYLRVRPLIVRRGDNEVEFREFARWGESLDQGIARVLREELLTRGAASEVQMGGLRGPQITAELSVRVLNFEGAMNGNVDVRAIWELTSTGNAKVIARGDFRAAGLQWDGKSEGSLAAQFSKGVTMLADDIGAALTKNK